MPIVAVGIAVGAAAFAGSAVVAAGLTAITALGVVAAVGATVSAIGAVTGDKALTYVGAGLGLVGGIGSLAASAGVLGEDAASGVSLFGPSTAASASDASTAVLGCNGAVDSGAFDTGSAAASTSSDAIDSLSGEPAAASGASMTPPPGAGEAGSTMSLGPPAGDSDIVAMGSQDAPTAGAATAGAPTGQGSVAPTAPLTAPAPNLSLPPSALTPAAGTINGGDGALPGDVSAQTGAVLDGGATTPTSSGSSALDGILGFVKNNQLLSYGVLQAGGQLLSGLTSTLTPAQVGALNAQAASNQAAANLTTQQTQNLAQPRSTAALAPVTGAPNNIITPPTAGIINGAPPVNVTGAPA